MRIGQDQKELSFLLESDGAPPSGPIREAGGLLSLRALAESRGGRMEVESNPSFRLRLFLPSSGDKG